MGTSSHSEIEQNIWQVTMTETSKEWMHYSQLLIGKLGNILTFSVFSMAFSWWANCVAACIKSCKKWEKWKFEFGKSVLTSEEFICFSYFVRFWSSLNLTYNGCYIIDINLNSIRESIFGVDKKRASTCCRSRCHLKYQRHS